MMNKHLSTCLGLLLLARTSPALAATPPAQCTNIRFDLNGGPLDGIEPSNQGPLNICTTHAAAQVVAARRGNLGLDAPSPLIAAIENAALGYSNVQELMPIEKVLSEVQFVQPYSAYVVLQNRSCPLSESREHLLGGDARNYLKDLHKIYFDYQKDLKKKKPTAKADAIKNIQRVFQNKLGITDFSHIDPKRYDDALNSKDWLKYLAKAVGLNCRPESRGKTDGTTLNSKFDLPDEENLKVIHELLEPPNGSPYLIRMCGRLLYSGRNYKGATFQNGVRTFKKDCLGHSMVVAGRRYKEGRCQILLRNSYGKTCSPSWLASFSGDWDCDKDKGSIWVDEETLARNTYGVDFAVGTNPQTKIQSPKSTNPASDALKGEN